MIYKNILVMGVLLITANMHASDTLTRLSAISYRAQEAKTQTQVLGALQEAADFINETPLRDHTRSTNLNIEITMAHINNYNLVKCYKKALSTAPFDESKLDRCKGLLNAVEKSGFGTSERLAHLVRTATKSYIRIAKKS